MIGVWHRQQPHTAQVKIQSGRPRAAEHDREAPTAGARVVCAPSNPKALLNACSRARLLAPLRWRSKPAGVNRPSTVTGTGAPIASRTGCSTRATDAAVGFPASGLSHRNRTGARRNGLPESGGVKLSESSAIRPRSKAGGRFVMCSGNVHRGLPWPAPRRPGRCAPPAARPAPPRREHDQSPA